MGAGEDSSDIQPAAFPAYGFSVSNGGVPLVHTESAFQELWAAVSLTLRVGYGLDGTRNTSYSAVGHEVLLCRPREAVFVLVVELDSKTPVESVKDDTSSGLTRL